MIDKTEKNWFITPILFITILSTLLIYPDVIEKASLFIILGTITLTVSLATQKTIQAYRAGQLDRSSMWRRIALDLVGIVLTLALAITSGRWAAEWVAAWAQASGWNAIGVTLSALLAALGAGFCVAWVAQWLWSKFVHRPA